MSTLFLSLLNFGAAIISMLLRGYVLVMMWGWFVLTQFPQAPHIGIAGALGLSTLAGLFRLGSLSRTEFSAVKKNDKAEELAYMLAVTGGSFIATLLCWGIGWVIHCYM